MTDVSWHRSLKSLLLMCCVIYIVTANGHFGSSDEEDLFLNTQLLVAQYAKLLGISVDVSADTLAQYRGPQEIGQSLLAVPLYLTSEFISHLLPLSWHTYLVRAVITSFNIGVTTLTIFVLYHWTHQLTSVSSAWSVAGIYGLATLAWPYSRTFYREPLVGLCLLVSFWLATRFRNNLNRTHLLTSIAFLILGIATKTTAIIVLPWWFVCWLKIPRQPRWRHVVALIAVLFSALLVFVSSLSAKQLTLVHYFQELSFDFQNNFSTFINYGLWGLLFSPGKGLLVCAPPVLLSVWGYRGFFRQYKREAIALAGTFATFVLVYSTRRGWHGGACWGPRYLLPVLPLLMLPIGTLLESLGQPSVSEHTRLLLSRSIVYCVIVVGVIVQVAAVSIYPLNYYFVKSREGVISLESFDGGPKYLYEIYFEPQHSPIVGQGILALHRVSSLLYRGTEKRLDAFPSDSHALRDYFISLETLDFWWLHLILQPNPEVRPR